jgi:hypothetical protein
LDFEEGKRADLFGSGKTLRRRYNLMRGLEVLDQGHLKLSWEGFSGRVKN